jgi:hypothetical protein
MDESWQRISELENTDNNNNVFAQYHKYFETNIRTKIPKYLGILSDLKIANTEWKANEKFNDVYLLDNFLETKAIETCLKFEKEISPIIHNWPLTNIIIELQTMPLAISENLVLANMMELFYSNNAPKWRREKYNTFVRLAPFRLADYIVSPIYNVVLMLEKIARSFAVCKGITEELYMSLCVLQQIPKGASMGVHKDTFAKRRISFIYYITDTFLDFGGELRLHYERQGEPVEFINPAPNRLILIDLTRDGGPWHSVAKYTGDSPRLSIVGFLSGI